MRNKGITSFMEISDAVNLLINNALTISRIVKGRPFSLIGRPLANAITSPVDRPPLDMSHVDGFSIRSIDSIHASKENPVRLRIEGCIKPSQNFKPIEPGKAVKIYTGGYLPPGADTVAPIEEVEVEGNDLLIFRSYHPYENVDRKGSDVKKGDILSYENEILTSTKAALFEALGIYEVSVIDRPVAGLLTFGDELTDVLEEAKSGKTLNFLSPLIEQMLNNLGCNVKYYGIVPDDVELAKRRIMEALDECDLVLTIGGSSVSEIDVASLALKEISEIFVKGLKLQPGRVGGFAIMNRKPVFTLPGLIHSTVNVFNYIVAPLICYIQKIDYQSLIEKLEAKLSQDLTLRKWIGFRRVVWVKLRAMGDEFMAVPRHGQSSLISLIGLSDGYIEVPPSIECLKAQSKVMVYRPAWMDPRILK